MSILTEGQWAEIDDYIRGGQTIHAVRLYRELTHASIKESMDVISGRKPSKLKPTLVDPEREAFQKLEMITPKIVVIEASWDGNSDTPFFIRLAAITDGASEYHLQYTEYPLCTILPDWVRPHVADGNSMKDALIAEATRLGAILSNDVGADFVLTSQEVWDRKRFWELPAL